MDYQGIYNRIIEKRQQNPLRDSDYGEVHHIIPKSLGGSEEKKNLVKLSAREHFICHALLSEIYEKYTFKWYKMNNAFLMMKTNCIRHQRYFNSRLYELKRRDFSEVMKEAQRGSKNSQYGTVWISNIEEEVSKKVGKENLAVYLERGYIEGRILDFGKHKGEISKQKGLTTKQKELIEKRLVQIKEKEETTQKKGQIKEKAKKNANNWWQQLQDSDKSISEFVASSEYKYTVAAFAQMLRKYIPEYKTEHGKAFNSRKKGK